MLRVSKRGTLAELERERWLDCQPPFEEAHYLTGFAWPDGKFRFKPDWENVPFRSPYKSGPVAAMPALPDHWTSIERRTPRTRSGSPPRRRADSSTRPSTRRRRRWRRRSGRR